VVTGPDSPALAPSTTTITLAASGDRLEHRGRQLARLLGIAVGDHVRRS
jgi:hypothetical protein